ncbi:Hypothetical protein SRAE_0000066100 [Strongyloides ratti]|uniref:Uncharacterized protein n=1 Tax=Strongyloides ratti TaxID=34506 RepID=A0A090KVK1_STRRB|nr:Hypothetical protein SRAE_0000066100 [Strongyloides ratti]CEF61540.1 Hypothetical protein SRAE_0000066100 [Strongyloides ratti]
MDDGISRMLEVQESDKETIKLKNGRPRKNQISNKDLEINKNINKDTKRPIKEDKIQQISNKEFIDKMTLQINNLDKNRHTKINKRDKVLIFKLLMPGITKKLQEVYGETKYEVIDYSIDYVKVIEENGRIHKVIHRSLIKMID